MNDRKHITMVDDDLAIQDSVKMMLEFLGYRVTLYGDGEALLAGRFEHPDLIILDKQLPGIDGLDLCLFLKKQETTKHIPILMLSASPQIAAQAKAACADGFLEKPFRMQAMKEEIARLIVR